MASQSFDSDPNTNHPYLYSQSLLHLLNNFAHHISSHHYYPRFNIEEHEHTYELYGDLPGAQQASLKIAAIDDRTIEISGSTARHSMDKTLALGNGQTEMVLAPAHSASDPSVVVSYANSKPAPTVDKTPDGGELTKTDKHEEAKPATEWKVKHLMTERQSGEFHRIFPFANSIKEREVTASFNNGVLHVTAPKGPGPVKNQIKVYWGR